MSDEHKLALIVDPDPIHLDIMEGMLHEEMEVLLAKTGAECLEMVEYKQPNIILMEKALPDIDGYALCKALKEKMGEFSCPILILTEERDIYEKMEGYKHGCDEFLTKPFQVEELFTKILLCIEMHAIQIRLRDRVDESMNTALNAIKMGGELGAILQFVEQSAKTSSYEELGELVISTLGAFELDSCVMLKTYRSSIMVGCEANSPEEHVLAMCSEKDRFVTMGEKMITNHDSVSLLVTNMPLEDNERYHELKDTLGIIINAIQTRVVSLDNEKRLQSQHEDGLNEAIESCNQKMLSIRNSLANHSKSIRSISDNLQTELRDTLFSLGLTEEQEESIIARVDHSVNLIHDTSSNLHDIEQHFASLTRELAALLKTK